MEFPLVIIEVHLGEAKGKMGVIQPTNCQTPCSIMFRELDKTIKLRPSEQEGGPVGTSGAPC